MPDREDFEETLRRAVDGGSPAAADGDMPVSGGHAVMAVGWLSAEVAERVGAMAGGCPAYPQPPEWIELWRRAVAETREAAVADGPAAPAGSTAVGHLAEVEGESRGQALLRTAAIEQIRGGEVSVLEVVQALEDRIRAVQRSEDRAGFEGDPRELSLALTALEDVQMRFTRGLAKATGVFAPVDLERLEARAERERFEAEAAAAQADDGVPRLAGFTADEIREAGRRYEAEQVMRAGSGPYDTAESIARALELLEDVRGVERRAATPGADAAADRGDG